MPITDKTAFDAQLSHGADEPVKQAYQVFADCDMPAGFTIRPTGHGYISRELRFEGNGHWYYSAVLNKGWVLWYYRWPALRDGLVRGEDLLERFPSAEMTKTKDIKVRVKGPDEARAVVRSILNSQP